MDAKNNMDIRDEETEEPLMVRICMNHNKKRCRKCAIHRDLSMKNVGIRSIGGDFRRNRVPGCPFDGCQCEECLKVDRKRDQDRKSTMKRRATLSENRPTPIIKRKRIAYRPVTPNGTNHLNYAEESSSEEEDDDEEASSSSGAEETAAAAPRRTTIGVKKPMTARMRRSSSPRVTRSEITPSPRMARGTPVEEESSKPSTSSARNTGARRGAEVRQAESESDEEAQEADDVPLPPLHPSASRRLRASTPMPRREASTRRTDGVHQQEEEEAEWELKEEWTQHGHGSNHHREDDEEEREGHFHNDEIGRKDMSRRSCLQRGTTRGLNGCVEAPKLKGILRKADGNEGMEPSGRGQEEKLRVRLLDPCNPRIAHYVKEDRENEDGGEDDSEEPMMYNSGERKDNDREQDPQSDQGEPDYSGNDEGVQGASYEDEVDEDVENDDEEDKDTQLEDEGQQEELDHLQRQESLPSSADLLIEAIENGAFDKADNLILLGAPFSVAVEKFSRMEISDSFSHRLPKTFRRTQEHLRRAREGARLNVIAASEVSFLTMNKTSAIVNKYNNIPDGDDVFLLFVICNFQEESWEADAKAGLQNLPKINGEKMESLSKSQLLYEARLDLDGENIVSVDWETGLNGLLLAFQFVQL